MLRIPWTDQHETKKNVLNRAGTFSVKDNQEETSTGLAAPHQKVKTGKSSQD